MINQNFSSFFQCFLRMNGTVRSNLKYQLFIVSLLFYTEVFYSILHITYRRINRVDWNYIHISTIFAVFISGDITTTLIDCNINLHS